MWQNEEAEWRGMIGVGGRCPGSARGTRRTLRGGSSLAVINMMLKDDVMCAAWLLNTEYTSCKCIMSKSHIYIYYFHGFEPHCPGYNPTRSAVVKELEFLPLEQKAVQSDVQSTGTTHVAALTPQRLPLLLGNQPSVFYFINCATVPRPVPLSSGARSPFDPGDCFLCVENWLRRPWWCTVKQKYWVRSRAARASLKSSTKTSLLGLWNNPKWPEVAWI